MIKNTQLPNNDTKQLLVQMFMAGCEYANSKLESKEGFTYKAALEEAFNLIKDKTNVGKIHTRYGYITPAKPRVPDPPPVRVIKPGSYGS